MYPGTAAGSAEVDVSWVDGNAITFRDEVHRTTLVWFSYPADNRGSEAGRRESLDN
jgi:hypothetical protein